MELTKAMIELNHTRLNLYGYYLLNNFLYDSREQEAALHERFMKMFTEDLIENENLRKKIG